MLFVSHLHLCTLRLARCFLKIISLVYERGLTMGLCCQWNSDFRFTLHVTWHFQKTFFSLEVLVLSIFLRGLVPHIPVHVLYYYLLCAWITVCDFLTLLFRVSLSSMLPVPRLPELVDSAAAAFPRRHHLLARCAPTDVTSRPAPDPRCPILPKLWNPVPRRACCRCPWGWPDDAGALLPTCLMGHPRNHGSWWAIYF